MMLVLVMVLVYPPFFFSLFFFRVIFPDLTLLIGAAAVCLPYVIAILYPRPNLELTNQDKKRIRIKYVTICIWLIWSIVVISAIYQGAIIKNYLGANFSNYIFRSAPVHLALLTITIAISFGVRRARRWGFYGALAFFILHLFQIDVFIIAIIGLVNLLSEHGRAYFFSQNTIFESSS